MLFRGGRVTLTERRARPEEKKERRRRGSTAAPAEPNAVLYERLRLLRYRLAEEQGVPPYVIFSNVTLADMAAKKPRDSLELLDVAGVGEVKARRYGAAFLKEIENWRKTQDG